MKPSENYFSPSSTLTFDFFIVCTAHLDLLTNDDINNERRLTKDKTSSQNFDENHRTSLKQLSGYVKVKLNTSAEILCVEVLAGQMVEKADPVMSFFDRHVFLQEAAFELCPDDVVFALYLSAGISFVDGRREHVP